MIVALGRMKLVLIALSLVILAILLWLFVMHGSTEKIPSRGVFVNSCISIVKIGAKQA